MRLECGFEMSITHQVISRFHSSKFMSSKPRQLMKSELVSGATEPQPGCLLSLTWLCSNYLEYTFPRHFPSAPPRERSMAPEQNFYFSTTMTSNISGYSTCFGENIKCYNVVFIPMLHTDLSSLFCFSVVFIYKTKHQKWKWPERLA